MTETTEIIISELGKLEFWEKGIGKVVFFWGLSLLIEGCFLPGSSHGLAFVCVWVQIAPVYKDISHIGLRPILIIHFNLTTFLRPSLHIQSHAEVVGVKTLI